MAQNIVSPVSTKNNPLMDNFLCKIAPGDKTQQVVTFDVNTDGNGSTGLPSATDTAAATSGTRDPNIGSVPTPASHSVVSIKHKDSDRSLLPTFKTPPHPRKMKTVKHKKPRAVSPPTPMEAPKNPKSIDDLPIAVVSAAEHGKRTFQVVSMDQKGAFVLQTVDDKEMQRQVLDSTAKKLGFELHAITPVKVNNSVCNGVEVGINKRSEGGTENLLTKHPWYIVQQAKLLAEALKEKAPTEEMQRHFVDTLIQNLGMEVVSSASPSELDANSIPSFSIACCSPHPAVSVERSPDTATPNILEAADLPEDPSLYMTSI